MIEGLHEVKTSPIPTIASGCNQNRPKDLRDEFAMAYVNIVLAGKDIPIWDELWNDAYDFADHGMKARGK